MLLLEKRFLLLLSALSALPACTSSEARPTAEGEELVECYAIWSGALQDYDAQSVTVRACLDESWCTDEQLVTAEYGASRDYGTIYFYAAFYPEGIYQDETINLVVSFRYPPEFAAGLTDDDRATLSVKAEDGGTLLESVSAVPYQDHVTMTNEGDLHCRSLYLRLDGSARPLPTSNPDEAPPSR